MTQQLHVFLSQIYLRLVLELFQLAVLYFS